MSLVIVHMVSAGMQLCCRVVASQGIVDKKQQVKMEVGFLACGVPIMNKIQEGCD